MKAKWLQRFIKDAELTASWSQDRSTKVGAVIVDQENTIISKGFNGMPMGIDDSVDSRHERPQKYEWTAHAEENAILIAGRHGKPLIGASIIITMFPCARCARAIIQSGISHLYCPTPDAERWGETQQIAMEMLTEAGTKLLIMNKLNELIKAKAFVKENEANIFCEDGGHAEIRHNGEMFLTDYYQDRLNADDFNFETCGTDTHDWELLSEGKLHCHEWPKATEITTDMIEDAVHWLGGDITQIEINNG